MAYSKLLGWNSIAMLCESTIRLLLPSRDTLFYAAVMGHMKCSHLKFCHCMLLWHDYPAPALQACSTPACDL